MPYQSTIDPYYKTLEWRALRNQTLHRDKHRCRYCGNSAVMVDHVIPRKRGGKDEMTNLVACCPRCNKLLGNKRFRDVDAKKQWVLKQIRPQRQ